MWYNFFENFCCVIKSKKNFRSFLENQKVVSSFYSYPQSVHFLEWLFILLVAQLIYEQIKKTNTPIIVANTEW